MNARYRIAMIAACPFPAARGTPIRIFRIADEVARRGHDVDVYTYHLGDPVEDVAFRIERTANIARYSRTSPGPTYAKLLLLDPLLSTKLATGIARKRYDLIHAHHVEGLLAVLPTRVVRRVPTVFDVHTLLKTELPSYPMGLPKRFLAGVGRAFDRRLPRYADHVITVSEEIRDEMVATSKVPSDAVSVIPNGVEPEFLDAERPSGERGQGGKKVVVYAGGLAPYQGIDLLLDAFARARQARPDLVLRIISETSFREFDRQAHRLGVRDHIEWIESKLEDLPGQLAGADVAVNPRGYCEGLPQKLLNYMAAGSPIVSFAGSARFVRHEESGLVVPDGDCKAFAEAMVRLVDNPGLARRLGNNARAFVREHLSWEHTVDRVEDVYAKMLRSDPERT